MGTSSLYKGPKSAVLLPSDFSEDEEVNGEEPQEQTDDEANNEGNDEEEPKESFMSAKRLLTQSFRNRNTNVKTAIRSYVKASGGYKQAARQARVARQLTGKMFYLLTGSPADIKSRFEEIGIQVENRPVKDVLSDICQYLAPKPDSLEDALVTDALMEALSKLYETIDVKEASFDVVNKELLQKMLMLFVKEYIYLKIIRDCSYGALKKCESVREIKEGEKKVKNYVESIVDAVLPSYFEEDVTQDEIVTAVTGMYEACYKEAERI